MKVTIKTFKQAGVLAWEYNPFRNYRVNKDIESKKKNELVDFETDQLQFSLEHPVDIIPLYSYDGSVNLILNDGLNSPKLINSRFSVTEKNKYLIVDRKGNNDSNIYDEDLFDIETSLYKISTTFPLVEFINSTYGGSLPIGNYHFYFKLQDADGNSTDFIAESGLVSVFIGTTPHSIQSGFVNLNSNKLVHLLLTNVDSSYPYVEVYYTRSTSEPNLNKVTESKVIDKKFIVNNLLICDIIITGEEITYDVSVTDINTSYTIIKNAETQTTCLSMLFLGNIEIPEIKYEELSKLSLFIYPKANYKENYNFIDLNYGDSNLENTYYNAKYIYDKTGYWESEYYRFGIVYIYKNNLLSPVFNIRGKLKINETPMLDVIDLESTINIDEETTIILNTDNHNASGVVSFDKPDEYNKIIGIDFVIDDKIKIELQKQGIVGFFFVRQKRIPSILALALVIATDKQSNTPVIPVKEGIISNKKGNKNEVQYITERFLDDNQRIDSNFIDRLYFVENLQKNAAICPDYDVNEAYLNSFFTGDNLYLEYDYLQPANDYLTSTHGRHFYNKEYSCENKLEIGEIKVVGVPDNIPLVAIGEHDFRGKAGLAETLTKFEFINSETKKTKSVNLLRGVYGSYLGFDLELNQNKIVNIKTIPSDQDFMIRALDKSPFYAISNRIMLFDLNIITCYRGDCYICQFTHRMNRNFNDPSAPYNDKIVDPKTLVNKFKYDDGTLNVEELNKVNLGDINAVLLGMWVTSYYRSSINHNIRATDGSFVSEAAAIGHPRGFYPLQLMSTAGNYKTPECKYYNKGMETSVSEKLYALSKNVPAFKNDFSNRIIYSDVHINDAYVNGYRIFRSTCFKDYNKELGSITKLITLGASIVCVFEHGIGLIPIKERVVSGNGTGGNVYINTPQVLPDNINIISDNIGSLWKDSVIKTPYGVYGVDTVAKKLWRVSSNGMELLSENYLMLEFINNNITLGERELIPLLGVRNVKTVYNAFKQDVMFTFYDNLEGHHEKAWNLCFNELLKVFTTFYSWIPSFMECIDNTPYSFDRDTSKLISKLAVSLSNNFKLYQDITVENSTITNDTNWSTLLLVNPNIEKTGISYTLEYDLFGNYNNFIIEGSTLKLINPENVYNKDIIPEYIGIHLNLLATFERGEIEFTKKYSILLILDYLKDLLTTSFWKHGLDTKPTNWYGKQHPFEFECVVVNDPSTHKIFSNLELVANKAEPESFHYEIIGESFDFSKDKPNMYYRQEALKAIFLNNGSNVTYDPNFINHSLELQNKSADLIKKYVYRQDKINSIEDYYIANSAPDGYTYKHLSGSELIYYPHRQEYRIWQHSPAININNLNLDSAMSIIEGNCLYLEDRWKISINPVLITYKNEYIDSDFLNSSWINNKPILPIYNSEIPKETFDTLIDNNGKINIPQFIKDEYNYLNPFDMSDWGDRKEIDLKDKFIKIRIRYSGKELAVIDFLNTVYRISYS